MSTQVHLYFRSIYTRAAVTISYRMVAYQSHQCFVHRHVYIYRDCTCFTARAAMLARYQLSQFCLSVRLSVTRVQQSQTMHCRYFDTTRKANHSSFLTPTVVGGRRPLPSEICVQSDAPPFEKRRLRQISAYIVSTVIACSHRRHGQDKTRQFCFVRVGSVEQALHCPNM